MEFTDAIKTCFNKYANFDGTAGRPEFWWWVLFCFLGNGILGAINWRLGNVFALATLVPSLAVGARRLHDTDRSGWLQLLGLIPIIGWILLIIWCAEAGRSNRYSGGAAPT
ncbi:MAG: DUF805 domain-containing protein [Steroidobacteraceae bacterium]